MSTTLAVPKPVKDRLASLKTITESMNEDDKLKIYKKPPRKFHYCCRPDYDPSERN
jgi:hypothetical protein